MIGHERIIELRNRGEAPQAVFIDPMCQDAITRSVASAVETSSPALPVVVTGDTKPERADLRFVRGLRVHLGPFGESLAWHTWWDAIVEAGASEVYGCDPQTMEVFTWQR